MTDIVERLRTMEHDMVGPYRGLTLEAADELERLRNDYSILKTDYDALRADNERLRALVKDLADDLEAEVKGRNPAETLQYPSEQRRYERDMANVYEARRALEPKP